VIRYKPDFSQVNIPSRLIESILLRPCVVLVSVNGITPVNVFAYVLIQAFTAAENTKKFKN
jgi:hypothetical protein